MTYRSDKRIYVDDEDNIVDEGDPKATRLLVAERGELTDQEAARYGLAGTKEEQQAANKARGVSPSLRAADKLDPAANDRAARIENEPGRVVTRSGIETVSAEPATGKAQAKGEDK